MPKNPQQRLSLTDTRQLLARLVAAREQYSTYLREVATGKRQADLGEKELLKMQCDETLYAWRAAHEAWRKASALIIPHTVNSRDN